MRRVLAGELAGVARPTRSWSSPTPARSSARCCCVAQVLRLGLPDLPRPHHDRRAARARRQARPAAPRARARHPGARRGRAPRPRARRAAHAARRIPESWSRPAICCRPNDARGARGLGGVGARRASLHRAPGREPRSPSAIDRVVLHPLAGTLLFAVVMVLFFQLIFAWAQPAMNAIDAAVGVAARARRARPLPAGPRWPTSWPTA